MPSDRAILEAVVKAIGMEHLWTAVVDGPRVLLRHVNGAYRFPIDDIAHAIWLADEAVKDGKISGWSIGNDEGQPWTYTWLYGRNADREEDANSARALVLALAAVLGIEVTP